LAYGLTAARPVIVPRVIVVDHGKVFVSESFKAGRRSWTIVWPEDTVHEEADRLARDLPVSQPEAMALPRDYDINPGRFRLGARVTARYLTGGEGIYAHIAGMLGRAGAHLVADIGCGEGALAAAARSPQLQIVGIDASPVMLTACPGPRVQAEARRLPFASGSFDAAVTVNMLYHLPDPAEAIREAHRILHSGGVFIATAISRYDSPELSAVWKPAPSTFDAGDASGIVASVFGTAEAERWDAPLITLPDHDAVRDYLIARFVPLEQAAASAAKIRTPAAITKRGAFIRATR
jgi:SAM-dependent methyltransferase